MTHIENIPHILQNGLTHSKSINANPNFVSIGDGSLITTRNNFTLNNGRKLGDYIPFYFGPRTPMLYVMQHGFNMVTPTKSENIVYCVSSVQKIINQGLDFIFTDGHAVDHFSTQYSIADIQSIHTYLDMDAINAKYWRDENDLDRKRRKEAEFLVLGDIAIECILEFIVANQTAMNRLVELGINLENINIKSDFYF